jgi:hypothetical protein
LFRSTEERQKAARTFREDVASGGLRVAFGVVIIGLFSILDALPHPGAGGQVR